MIPEQAVEAAMRAWGVTGEDQRKIVGTILEAAAPHMLSHEREQTRLAHLDAMVNRETKQAELAAAFEQGQKSGMRHADRLVAAAKIGKPELPGPMSANPYRTTK